MEGDRKREKRKRRVTLGRERDGESKGTIKRKQRDKKGRQRL